LIKQQRLLYFRAAKLLLGGLIGLFSRKLYGLLTGLMRGDILKAFQLYVASILPMMVKTGYLRGLKMVPVCLL
jgi:hypothetical protein